MARRHFLYGKQTVAALLAKQPHLIKEAWLLANNRDHQPPALRDQLKACGVSIRSVGRHELDELADGGRHQGVIVAVTPPQAVGEAELKDLVRERGSGCLLLVLDGVQDPRNLGACLRVADGAGVDAVVVPKDRAVGMTSVVAKAASGAAYSVPLVRVTNLSRTLRWLSDEGLMILGMADQAATNLYGAEVSCPLAVVMGSENKGLRRLTAERCDLQVAIPMSGAVSSLNVSVAAAVVLFELRRRLAAG